MALVVHALILGLSMINLNSFLLPIFCLMMKSSKKTALKSLPRSIATSCHCRIKHIFKMYLNTKFQFHCCCYWTFWKQAYFQNRHELNGFLTLLATARLLTIKQGKKVCKATALRSCHCFPCTLLPGLSRPKWLIPNNKKKLHCSVVNSGGAL